MNDFCFNIDCKFKSDKLKTDTCYDHQCHNNEKSIIASDNGIIEAQVDTILATYPVLVYPVTDSEAATIFNLPKSWDSATIQATVDDRKFSIIQIEATLSTCPP